jgi:hypothetical protein
MAAKKTNDAANAAVAQDEKERADAYAAGDRGLEKASGELGSDQVQKAVDEAEAKGYIGVKVDPRPNSDYSMEGGAPVAQVDESKK